MPLPNFRSEGEVLDWMASGPSFDEIRTLMQRPPQSHSALVARHYKVSELSVSQLLQLLQHGDHTWALLFSNPSLTSAQVVGLVETALDNGLESGTLSQFGNIFVLGQSAGHPLPRAALLERFRSRLAGMATNPKRFDSMDGVAVVDALFRHFWFDLTADDLAQIWAARERSFSIADDIIRHPSAPGSLLREVFGRFAQNSMVAAAFATCGRLDEVPGAKEEFLANGQSHVIASMVPWLTDEEFDAAVKRHEAWPAQTLAAFFHVLEPAEKARIRPHHLLPLMNSSELDIRLAGQKLAAEAAEAQKRLQATTAPTPPRRRG